MQRLATTSQAKRLANLHDREPTIASHGPPKTLTSNILILAVFGGLRGWMFTGRHGSGRVSPRWHVSLELSALSDIGCVITPAWNLDMTRWRSTLYTSLKGQCRHPKNGKTCLIGNQRIWRVNCRTGQSVLHDQPRRTDSVVAPDQCMAGLRKQTVALSFDLD